MVTQRVAVSGLQQPSQARDKTHMASFAKPPAESNAQNTSEMTTELEQHQSPIRVKVFDEGTMTVNRLVVLIGSILGLIGIVAWIGELDLGLEESVPATVEQPSDSQRSD